MSTDFEDKYQGHIRRRLIFLLIGIFILLVSIGLSCLFDGRSIGFFDVFSIIWNHIAGASYEYGTSDYWDDYIVVNSRLPRTVLAIVAGAGMAICGVVMQSVMSNPLADPYTTGMSSGACLGAIIAISMGFTLSSSNMSGIVGMSFAMALIPALIVIVISRVIYTSPATLILIGTAISYLFNALNTLILVYEEGDTLSTAYEWTIGSLESTMWSDLWIPCVFSTIGGAILILLSGKLNVLMMGEEQAKSMGVDVDNLRTILLMLMSFMIAAIISYTGILGFIGLVIPHIVRMFIGSDNRFVIPASMVFGGAFLLLMDTLARVVISPYEMPVGILLMFIGGPVFLLIIARKKSVGGLY